jgi:hypothetical protein
VLLLVLASLTASGCGFILTGGPPAGHATMPYFSCTESKAGPTVDAVWAGLNLVGALFAITDAGEIQNRTEATVVGLSWGALSGTAALVGFRKVERCRAAKLEWAKRREPGETEPNTAAAGAESP